MLLNHKLQEDKDLEKVLHQQQAQEHLRIDNNLEKEPDHHKDKEVGPQVVVEDLDLEEDLVEEDDEPNYFFVIYQ